MSMRQITLDIPEKVFLAEKADEASFARELRLLAAVKLYELGRLSSGRAAELAGMPRVEFLLALGHYQVFPFQAELNDLEAPGSEGILASGGAPGSEGILPSTKKNKGETPSLPGDDPSMSAHPRPIAPPPRHLRVFLASPEDVAEERALALQVLEELQPA